MKRAALAVAALAAGCSLAAASARAQPIPSTPITLGGGLVTIGADLALSVAPEDDSAWFNYTDYEHDAMRVFRAGLLVAFRPSPHVWVLTEARAETGLDAAHWDARLYTAFVRVRPWLRRSLDLQAGLVPQTFGSFGRRTYGPDNPLIGMPLAYQYLTTIRPDAMPASADELVSRRGQGWLVRYSVGNPQPHAGLPLVNVLRNDPGLQVRFGDRPVSVTAAVTAGSLANPGGTDASEGVQFVGRVAYQRGPGFIVGVSGARGSYTTDALRAALPPGLSGARYDQQALGVDVEGSRGHWVLRAEAVWNRWRVPAVTAPSLPEWLRSGAIEVEARYKIGPRFYVAARAGRLAFAEIDASIGRTRWDAPVRRFEAGGGFYVLRTLLLKAVVQHNRREGEPLDIQRQMNTVAAQLLYWF